MIVNKGRHQRTAVNTEYVTTSKKIKNEGSCFDYKNFQTVQKTISYKEESKLLFKNASTLLKDWEKQKSLKWNTLKLSKNNSASDKCFSPMSKEFLNQAGKDSAVLNSPIFKEKLKQKMNERKTSKANLYTPNIKMSFCSTQKITPVLKSRRDSEGSNYKSIDKAKKQLVFHSHKSTPDLNFTKGQSVVQNSSSKVRKSSRKSNENRESSDKIK